MRFLPKFASNAGKVAAPPRAAAPPPDAPSELDVPSHLLKTVSLISAALGAVALGLIVGREIRQRYKFNRRTPYDLYAHSGDEMTDVEFGVGI